ncbi:hypothetical protein [Streptomyces sp. 1268]|uniref:hypothetical protein n=1 Tax=Streptomyces sp. 1268 TaxID=3231942 RepID=UPI0038D35E75
MQCAARHPRRVGRLVLVGPGVRAVGVPIDGDMRRALALRRAGEPWFPAAFAALETIIDGGDGDWEAVAPFLWGRWDAEARRHHAAGRPDNAEAVAGFAADGAFDPAVTRAGLAGFEGPALLLTGAFDLNSPPRAVGDVLGVGVGVWCKRCLSRPPAPGNADRPHRLLTTGGTCRIGRMYCAGKVGRPL